MAAAGAIGIPALTKRLEAEGLKKIIITTDDPAKYDGVGLAAGVVNLAQDVHGLPLVRARLLDPVGVLVLLTINHHRISLLFRILYPTVISA